MYGKKLIRKMGSLVVVATLIASAFVVLQNGTGVALVAMHDVAVSTDYEGAVNGIKILHNGQAVGANESLYIGEIYKICYKLENKGNVTESIDVTITVSKDGWNETWHHTHSLDSNETGTYSNDAVWNTSGLEPGNYTITINASISGDANWSDNERTRIVKLVNPVNVTINYPVGGEVIGGIIPIKWNANSMVGSLSIKLEYKNETGEWKTIADGIENTGIYYWDATGLQKGAKYKIKVTATNENGTSNYVESGFFTISQLDVSPKTVYYKETKDVYVNNTEGTVTLYRSDNSTYGSQDGSPGNVIFFGTQFDMVGLWKVEDSIRGTFYIRVLPIKLNVSVSPESKDFVKIGAESYVTLEGYVKDKEGNAIKNVTVEVWKPGVKAGDGTPIATAETNDTGYYKVSSLRIALYGAGKYNITARIGDFANPNAFGYTIFTVNSVEANVTLKNNTAVGGFDIGKLIFEVTDANGNEILYHNYNISVYKDNELFAWVNNTGTSNEAKMQFNISGKTLTITSGMWETGDYTIRVRADIVGSINWEYTGSQDFSIAAPPKVTLKLISPSTEKFDVLALNNNVQTITIQIFGENMTTYGDRTNLKIGPNNENVTDRIKVEGDVIYPPPKEAYEYVGNGTWNIKVFPAHGDGKIYINVSWPDKGEASKYIIVENGGKATVEPTEMIVDTPTNITVTLKTKDGNPVSYVDELKLYYEKPSYWNNTNWELISNKSGVYNANGVFEFTNISSKYADVNIIVMAKFYGNQYVYAAIKSQPAHDLSTTLSPSNVMAGEKTKFSVNITRDGKAYDNTFIFYILNESQLQKLHNGELDLSSLASITPTRVSEGNYTFTKVEMDAGTFYLYVKTDDSKHDNLNNEPSFTVSKVSVSPSPSTLVKDVDKNVTVTFSVTWNGQPVNGTLKLLNISDYTSYTGSNEIEVKNGEANITGIDATEIGNVSFEFKPAETGSEYAASDGMLKVVAPSITIVEPAAKVAFMGVENLIVIKVTHPVTGSGCKDLDVKIKVPGGNLIDVGKTDENGKLLFGVIPLETGDIEIYVQDALAGKIEVVIGLSINAPTSIEKGKEMTIVVTTKGGNPVEGATVKVDGTTIGTTNANGIIKYTPKEVKTITITAEKSGYYSASFSVEVTKPPSHTPGFEFIGLAIGLLAAILIARRRK